jgi:hypothetical protein
VPTRPPTFRHLVSVLVVAATVLLDVPRPLPSPLTGPAQTVAANSRSKGCQFTRTRTQWTLKTGCTTKETIEIPNGVTLDGRGKTIKLAGPSSGFDSAGIRTKGAEGNVRNLKLDGSGLTGSCASRPVSGIAFLTSGRITNVAVADLRCGAAVAAVVTIGQPRRTIALANVTVTNVKVPGTGGVITLAGAADVTIANSAIRQGDAGDEEGDFGVWVLAGATATMERTTIEDMLIGISINQGGEVNARHNRITRVSGGMIASGATTVLAATDNQIVGRGKQRESFGVGYFDGASGTVDGNAVSDFRGTGSCGIRVAADAGAVTIGPGNTFPDPPGNEQNICDV